MSCRTGRAIESRGVRISEVFQYVGLSELIIEKTGNWKQFETSKKIMLRFLP